MLKAIQEQFLEYIETGVASHTFLSSLKQDDIQIPIQKLQIYRDSARGNWVALLELIFPVCLNLIGRDCFTEVAGRFVQHYSHDTYDLTSYAKDFPQFLLGCSHLQALKYLPEVARLEWACHYAKDCCDQSRLTCSQLEHLDEVSLEKLRLTIPCHASLLSFDCGIFEIWLQHQEAGIAQSLTLKSGGEQLLVHLRAYTLKIDRLDLIEFELLQLFQQGCVLAQVLQRAARNLSDHEVSNAFARLVKNGWLTRLS